MAKAGDVVMVALWADRRRRSCSLLMRRQEHNPLQTQPVSFSMAPCVSLAGGTTRARASGAAAA